MVYPSTPSRTGLSPEASARLATTLREATEADQAMNGCITQLDRLVRELSLAMSRHHASVTALLRQAGAAPQARTFSELQQAMTAMSSQYLALQNAIQMESRKFQSLSNASKTRREAALNAIQNTK